MKIALDEHIAPMVLDAIEALLTDDRNDPIEIVRAKYYVEAPSKSDTPWVKKFAEEGGSIIITGDKKMRGRPHERKALLDLGMVVFFTPAFWNNLKFMDKASYLLRWWSPIIQCAKNSDPSQCWQLPSNWQPNVDKIQNVTGPR